MKKEFEKYETLAASLTAVRDTVREQTYKSIKDLLCEVPNHEVLVDIEDDNQMIWTDDDRRVCRVFLTKDFDGHEIVLLDIDDGNGEIETNQEVYYADELDILSTISYIVVNELTPENLED